MPFGFYRRLLQVYLHWKLLHKHFVIGSERSNMSGIITVVVTVAVVFHVVWEVFGFVVVVVVTLSINKTEF